MPGSNSGTAGGRQHIISLQALSFPEQQALGF